MKGKMTLKQTYVVVELTTIEILDGKKNWIKK